MSRLVTPAVAAVAQRLGVNLDTLTGTGVGNRVTIEDARSAARRLTHTARMSAVSPTVGSRSYLDGPRRSEWGPNPVTVDLFGPSPVVDELREANPRLYTAAAADAPPPTLFDSGPLPPFTASGRPPSDLLGLPWMARHTAAREPDPGKVYSIFSELAGPPADAVAAAEYLYAADPGVTAYLTRVRQWASGALRAAAAPRPYEPAPAQQAAGDQLYKAMFGADGAVSEWDAGTSRDPSRWDGLSGT